VRSDESFYVVENRLLLLLLSGRAIGPVERR